MSQLTRQASGAPIPQANEWPTEMVRCINDIRPAVLGLTAGLAALHISREASNPAHQAHAVGSTVTLDWVVDRGTQAGYRIARYGDPNDPAEREYWTGTAWSGQPVWISPTAVSSVSLTGWVADAQWAVTVEALGTDGLISNALTWAILIGTGGSSDAGVVRTVVTVTPATTSLDNSATTATIRVAHVSGPAPTQVRIKRAFGQTVHYWTGTAWQTAETWATLTEDAQGGMDYTLTQFLVGSSTLTVTARENASADASTWSVAHEVAVVRADAQGNQTPTITLSGSATPAPGARVPIRFSFSDQEDGTTPTKVEMLRGTFNQRSTFLPTHHWAGGKWVATAQGADTFTAGTATSYDVPLTAGQGVSVRAEDSDGARSNTLLWTATVAPAAPVIARKGIATIRPGTVALSWTYADANGDAQTHYRLTEAPTGSNPTRYWDGSKWVAIAGADAVDLWVASSAHTVTVPVVDAKTYTVTVRSGTGAGVRSSGHAQWNCEAAPVVVIPNPSITVVGDTEVEPGNVTLTWRFSPGAANLPQARVQLIKRPTSSRAYTHYWSGTAWVALGDVLAFFFAHTAQTITVPLVDGETVRLIARDARPRASNPLDWDCVAPSAAGPPTIAHRSKAKIIIPSAQTVTVTWHYTSPTDDPQALRQILLSNRPGGAPVFFVKPPSSFGSLPANQRTLLSADQFFASKDLRWSYRLSPGWDVHIRAADGEGRKSNSITYQIRSS